MDLTFIQTISGCLNACIIGNKLCYETESGEIRIGKNRVNGVRSISGLHLLDSSLYYNDEGKVFEIQEEQLIMIFHDTNSHSIQPLSNGFFFSYYKESRKNNTYKLLDSESNMIWEASGNIFLQVHEKHIIEKKKFDEKEFKVCDLRTYETKWTFTSVVGTRIVNGPYLIGGNLIIILENIALGRYEIKVLDIDNGHQEWSSVINLRTPKVLGNILYEFAANTFGTAFLASIDIITRSIESTPIVFEERTSGALNSIFGNLLFFTYVTNGCGLGVIDLDSKEIVSLTELNLREGVSAHAPLIAADRIAIRDSENTLHLFTWNENQPA